MGWFTVHRALIGWTKLTNSFDLQGASQHHRTNDRFVTNAALEASAPLLGAFFCNWHFAADLENRSDSPLLRAKRSLN